MQNSIANKMIRLFLLLLLFPYPSIADDLFFTTSVAAVESSKNEIEHYTYINEISLFFHPESNTCNVTTVEISNACGGEHMGIDGLQISSYHTTSESGAKCTYRHLSSNKFEVTVNEKFGMRTNEYLLLFDNSSRILGFNGKQTNLYAAKNTYWNRKLIPIKSSNGIAKLPVNCKNLILLSDLK